MKNAKVSEQTLNRHFDMVADFMSKDFLIQIGHKASNLELKERYELILNDVELCQKYTGYLTKQLMGHLPILIDGFFGN